jgi:hypothetical protein
VAGNGASTDGKNRRQAARLETQSRVADRINPAMKAVKAAGPSALRDGGSA